MSEDRLKVIEQKLTELEQPKEKLLLEKRRASSGARNLIAL